MAGFSAGSAFISVVPSLRGFGESVKSQLRSENLEAEVRLNPELDEREGEAKADEAARKMSGRNVRFEAKVDTDKAEKSVLSFGQVMSGLRFAAIGTAGVAAFGGIATAAVGAGGLIGALAIPMTAVKLGMNGIKAAAGELKPQFDGLKTAVSGAFQTGLQPAIANIRAILPTLQVGLIGTAGGLSAIASQVTRVAASGAGLASIRTIFSSVNQVLYALAPVLAQIVGAFLRMGAVFSQTFLGVMVPALVRFGQAFSTMAAQLSNSGQLQAAFSGLFQVVGSLLNLLTPLIATGVRLMGALGPPLAQAINILAGPQAMGALSGILTAIAPVVGIVAQQLAQVLVGALVQLLPIAVQLAPILAQLAVIFGQALVQAIGLLGPGLGVLLQVLVPVLHAVVGALQFMQPILGPLVLAIGAWVIVQWALNSALLANPITWIVLLIAGLVVGVIYCWQHFQTFRDIVTGAWDVIKTAFSIAWNVISTIFSAISIAVRFLATLVLTVLAVPFVLAWNMISAVARNSWAELQAIWYGALAPALRFLGSVFTWLWRNIVEPVWSGISSAISAAWHFIYGSIFVPIANFLRAVLGPVFEWLWRNIIEPVWNGISRAISSAWNFIRGVFGVLMDGVHMVGQAFQSVADWIARAWDSIREAARRPVQWVVDVVYNNGIRPTWNGIAGLFGMAQLAPVHLAEGGVIPGFAPGVDSVPAMLSRGEGVLVPEAVRGLGPAFVGWANQFFSGGRSRGGIGTPQGGFANGGIVHLADGGILGGIGSFLAGTGDFLMKLFTDPAGAVKDLFSSMVGDAGRTPGAGGWTDALKKLPLKFLDAVIQKAKDWVKSLGSMGGGIGGGVQQWSGVALQALALAGQPASMLGLLLMQMQSESSGNPGIVNTWDVNARAGHPSMGLMQVIPTTFASYAGPLAGLGILNPLANIYAAIKYTLATYGSLPGGWHGHGYDNGGWLPPGPSLTWNNTGAPEPVLTRNQWADISALANGGSRGGGTTIVVNPSAGTDEVTTAYMIKRRLDFEERAVG